jgi:hypothetical protein
LGLTSAAIAATNPRWPRWLYPSDPTARLESLERSGNKLAAVAATEGTGQNERFGVFLGSSSLMLGINDVTLREESKLPIRWLELCSGGANGDDLARVFRMILWSGRKPEWIILGLQPDMLARTTNCLGPDGDEIHLAVASLQEDVWARRLGNSIADLEKLTSAYTDQIFPGRTIVNYRLREVIFAAKCGLFQACRMGIRSMFTAERDPWGVPGGLDRAGPLVVRQGYFKNGRYDRASYAVDNLNFRALEWLFDEADRQGIRVLVLNMPATRFDRDMQPPSAEQTLAALLQTEKARALPVLDLRTAFGDESFADLFHLSKAGREAASKRVGAFLRQHYGNRSPAAR